MGFDEIEAPDIVLVSHRGDVIAGVGAPDDESAIGVWAMSDWPMIRAVVHVHSLYAAAFSSTDAALNALSHEGCHLVPPDVVRIHSLSTWEKDSGLASLLGERAPYCCAVMEWSREPKRWAVRWPWLSISRSRVDSN